MMGVEERKGYGGGGGGLRGEEPRKLQLLNLRELLGDSALHFNLVSFYMMHKL